MRKIGQLAAAGSVGNASHASVPVDENEGTLSVEFEVTAVGATPTVTWKLQGSNDGSGVPDATSDWYDLMTVDAGDATEDISRTHTAVGIYAVFLELARRNPAKIRLETSANLNVTYEAEAYA